MIVECPRCKARYRVDEDVVAEEPTFKCSRCDHLFGHEAVPADAPESGPTTDPTPAAAAEPDPDPEPSFEIEPEPAPTARSSRRRAGRADAGSLDLPFATSPIETSDDEAADDEWRDEEPSFEFRETESEESEDLEESEEVRGDELDLPGDEDEEEPALADRGARDEPRFVRGFAPDEPPAGREDRLRRPFLVFLGVLVLFYGNLALYFRNHLPTTERTLAAVPLFGRLLVEDRRLQSRVYLRDLEGVYQRVKDGRTVFIVSGRAVNTADTAVKGVEVESALYDGKGSSIATKSIFCGNAMSLKIVKDLSSKEITILQRLQPPQRFEIAPGDAAGFSVVFLDPPEGFVEFSARVASAQPALS